jgi:hypothetical protein
MFPSLESRNTASLTSFPPPRRKDIRSPKTEREYKTEILSNNLSPRQRFKPIDYKENVVISINSTEPMRIKEYQKLCEIVTKFEHKKLLEKLRKTSPQKEFGFYAKKKGFMIKTKDENFKNKNLIDKLKSKTSMGIVQWDVGNQKMKIKTSRKGIDKDRCFSQSPKRRVDSEGDVIVTDVGFATTDFFKRLISGDKKEEQEQIKISDLDPDQKKLMYQKMSGQKHFMLPLEMTQLKNALRREEQLTLGQNELLIQDYSKIHGEPVECESPKGHKLSIKDNKNKKFSKYITVGEQSKLIQKEAYSHLSPRLKEILISNKETLRKHLS